MKFGGPVRTGSSSVCGSGRVTRACGVGALILGVAASPEATLFASGFPPRILMSIALFPVLFPAPIPPPVLGGLVAPLALGVPFCEPPGTPGCFPSGEMETCAARFPCGGATGAGGAGLAESAIKVEELPPRPASCVAATSGAGPASPVCALCAMRGAAPVFSSTFGRAGPVGVATIAKSPSFCSKTGTSGAGAWSIGRRRKGRDGYGRTAHQETCRG